VSREHFVNTITRGHKFRDWLVEVLDDRVQNKECAVNVYKINISSHTVCRYEFVDEGFSVVAKFLGEPKGETREYNPCDVMENEFENLKKVNEIINTSKPIARNKDFNCVIVIEYVSGKSLMWYMEHEKHLDRRLSEIAGLLRKLHDNTKINFYDKKKEFDDFRWNLDFLHLDTHTRNKFDELLGKWWNSPQVNEICSYFIHRDVTPLNYIFQNDKVYAIDFESSGYRNRIHDLGVLCAEIKNHFALKGSGQRAEPYIRHFLWEYSKDEEEFYKITVTLPFYMAYGWLRIARLGWHPDYYNYLLREAKSCLNAVK
jgi:tRNA A-37 threonylcarbamoyl transferase component Bud32